MSNETKPSTLLILARISGLILGCLWAIAAVPKLMDAQTFAESIRNYQLLPPWSIGPLARILPVLELVISVALITGILQQGAALLSIGLLTVFSIAMLQAMARGIDLSCGCFGAAIEAPVSWWNISRNLILMGLALLVLWKHPSRWPWRTSGSSVST